jgi:hypothetical protein
MINNLPPVPGFTVPDFHVTSHCPDATVIFYPWVYEDDQDPNITEDNYLNTTEVHAHSQIVAVSTTKPKGGVGSWEITLGSDRNWLSVLHPSCWCLIYLSDTVMPTTGPTGIQMVGIVKSVREVESVDREGRRTVRYQVSGVDFHEVLNTPVYLNPILLSLTDTDASLIYLSSKLQDIYGKSPGEVIETLFEIIVGQPTTVVNGKVVPAPPTSKVPTARTVPPALAARFSGSATTPYFTSFMARNIQANLLGKNMTTPLVTNGSTFWSMVEAYAHRVLNEVYTDLLPMLNADGNLVLMPTMVMRAIPFSTKDQQPHPSCIGFHSYGGSYYDPSTTSIVGIGDNAQAFFSGNSYFLSRSIRDGEILALDKGKGDAERFNFILHTPDITMDQTRDSAQVIYALLKDNAGLYPLSVHRNGLRMHVGSSTYLLGEALDSKAASNTADILNQITRDMWSKAHLYENGTVLVPGVKKHIPVGTAMWLTDRGLVGHVEAVSHSYTSDGEGHNTFRTSIAFSRLQAVSHKPADLTGQSSTSAHQGKWDRGVTFGRLT